MSVPPPWAFTLLTLAAFRFWKLLADDVILDWPRNWLFDRLSSPEQPSRFLFWAKFVDCPYCLGFWCCIALWLLWLAAPTFAVWIAVPLALSAVVGLLGDVWNELTD